MNKVVGVVGFTLLSGAVLAGEHKVVSDETISEQRHELAENTEGKGFGPQAPRDIDLKFGRNIRSFGAAPVSTKMNLCNIHFHKNAEHKGGEFTQYAGNGNGEGYQTGYVYAGKLTAEELKPIKGGSVCKSKHSQVFPGDTIEVHYVYSSAQVKPGPTLGSCISDEIKNPQLRVEAQVYVAVNDNQALDFNKLTAHGVRDGLYQATDIPNNTGTPVTYAGSTTGPGYNEKASPYQVTWNVRPKVEKVNIETIGDWCDSDNVFKEDHAHGVRNLVVNPDLLSPIE
ncbi:delta-class carbonic anhydrase [Marinomonas transparens]|uniref:Cadmium carbonic anhydrase n=1 Tax=Marinomonas transparens TaxID=2795388 RepID=A0A934JU99_9GAMM|nr:delta-class carbonic anhydrase [Marinomonas transparens]MBJ7537424.1 hypothetical protein [Marinomonas transparens]